MDERRNGGVLFLGLCRSVFQDSDKLEFRDWLLFGIWDIRLVLKEANYFTLSQLEFTLNIFRLIIRALAK
jgi:hypothetical protein